MTSQEEKRIREFNTELSGDIQIRILKSNDERGDVLARFCTKLARLAPKLCVLDEVADSEEAPAILIDNSLRYQAVPSGTELEPFLVALKILDKNPPRIADALRDGLKKIDLPSSLEIYIAHPCPFCPAVVEKAIQLSAANAHIHVTVIDCGLFPEKAESIKIQAVPTVVLDRNFRWTGSVPMEEIIAVMAHRDPAVLGPAFLERMITEGNASQLAGMILESGKIFPALFDVLVNDAFSIRLGGMVVMEEVAEKNPEMAAQAIDPLWRRFFQASDQVKGDIMYILGEVRSPKLIPKLRTVIEGSYSHEIREAAKEALEKIEI